MAEIKPDAMDCWHFIAPLIPLDDDLTLSVYVKTFHAFKLLEKEEKRKDGGKKVGQEFHEEERKEDKQEHGDIRQNFSHEEFDAIPAEGEESILVNGRLGQMK